MAVKYTVKYYIDHLVKTVTNLYSVIPIGIDSDRLGMSYFIKHLKHFKNPKY